MRIAQAVNWRLAHALCGRGCPGRRERARWRAAGFTDIHDFLSVKVENSTFTAFALAIEKLAFGQSLAYCAMHQNTFG
jgi:hypothetical protein